MIPSVKQAAIMPANTLKAEYWKSSRYSRFMSVKEGILKNGDGSTFDGILYL